LKDGRAKGPENVLLLKITRRVVANLFNRKCSTDVS
jgi:hypothetical protein